MSSSLFPFDNAMTHRSCHLPGLFFVIQNSQQRSIRTCYTGDTAVSTVRRPAAHRAYIHEVSKQTRIIQLQGFLFFGTISHVEDTIRSLVNDPTFYAYPVRFVVVDFSLVAGVDLSAAEAFVRVQRLLAAKGVVLVFCGVSRAEVGKALGSVGLLEQPYVELFETLNDAMECESWMVPRVVCSYCIRMVLTEYVTQGRRTHICARGLGRRKRRLRPLVSRRCTSASLTTRLNVIPFYPVLPGRQKVDVDFHETLVGSPRRLQLKDAGERIIPSGKCAPRSAFTVFTSAPSQNSLPTCRPSLSTRFSKRSAPLTHSTTPPSPRSHPTLSTSPCPQTPSCGKETTRQTGSTSSSRASSAHCTSLQSTRRSSRKAWCRGPSQVSFLRFRGSRGTRGSWSSAMRFCGGSRRRA